MGGNHFITSYVAGDFGSKLVFKGIISSYDIKNWGAEMIYSKIR